MSEPEKSSHWKTLASLLGTELPPEPEQAPPAPPQPAVPPPAPERTPPRKPLPPRPPSNWGALASDLGLAAPPPPEPTASRPAPEREEVSETGETAVGGPSKDKASFWEAAPAARDLEGAALVETRWDADESYGEPVLDPLEMPPQEFVDEAFDAIDVDLIPPVGSSSELDLDAELQERETSPEDRPRRRRRRRGRGRRSESGDRPREREESLPAPPVMGADAAMDLELEEEELESAGESPETGERSPPTGEGEEPRRRRRRRGRGRRGRRGAGEAPSGAVRPATEDKRAPVSDDLDSADDEDLLEAFGHEDEPDGDDESGDQSQFSHKKIPSWQEAVEGVISANMTSRANNPSGGSRGGRGRGRRDR